MPADSTEVSAMPASGYRRVVSAFGIKSGESALALLAFAYFFLLLCGYFILRPIRDNMGIEWGTARLPYLFSIIFVVMLAAVPIYGWVVSTFRKQRIVPIAYGFFGLHLIIFYFLLSAPIEHATIAPYFFVWVGVFNLFVVSVFWSYMVDIFSPDQARRLFGFIAAGGTLGALVGPLITQTIVTRIGTANLLPISLAFLMAALACVLIINRLAQRMPTVRHLDQIIGQSAFSGFTRVFRSRYLLAIAAWVVLGNMMSTFLYLEQQHIVSGEITNPDERVQLFARLDLAVSILTIMLQSLATARIIRRFGIGAAVAAQPLVTVFCLIGLAFAPILAVVIIGQVASRGFNFGISNPARHMLFSVVSVDEKYKAQNVIDTVVQRGGDASGGSVFASLMATAGLGLSAIAAVAVPVAAIWLALSAALGRMHDRAQAGSPP